MTRQQSWHTFTSCFRVACRKGLGRARFGRLTGAPVGERLVVSCSKALQCYRQEIACVNRLGALI